MAVDFVKEAFIKRLGCKSIYAQSASYASSLNDCAIYDTDKGQFFVKTHTGIDPRMFQAELLGLRRLEETQTVRIPYPFLVGGDNLFSYIIMEYLELSPLRSTSQKTLGEQLAKLHLIKNSKSFGFEIDNTIGTTPQINTWMDLWVNFFIDHRLRFQFLMIKEKYEDNELFALGECLLERVPDYFKGLSITPSLIHGDLWGGNASQDREGNPVVYDPAPYYAHHEAELSIAEMFGGFTSDFYDAYHALIPKDVGFAERQKLYQFYHYLNHYVIFGSSYRGSCVAIAKALY